MLIRDGLAYYISNLTFINTKGIGARVSGRIKKSRQPIPSNLLTIHLIQKLGLYKL